VGGAEERLRGGRAPVEQQAAAVVAGEPEASDVDRLACGGDGPAEAQVQAEAAQGAEAAGQPVDLPVAVGRGLAFEAPRAALLLADGGEAVGHLGDGLLQAGRDGGEVAFVVGDELRVGLRGEALGQLECAVGLRVHSAAPFEHWKYECEPC
jgi:hypothetical protein